MPRKCSSGLAELLLRSQSDEAEAKLNTWKLSYFESPGLRLFFTLPRVWTDDVLPLSVSTEADIVRAMIGRIEIVTPKQRALLRQLAHSPISSTAWVGQELEKLPRAQRSEIWDQLIKSNKSLDDFKLQVPQDYRAFLNLGRFREALVLNELQQRPTKIQTSSSKPFKRRPVASTSLDLREDVQSTHLGNSMYQACKHSVNRELAQWIPRLIRKPFGFYRRTT